MTKKLIIVLLFPLVGHAQSLEEKIQGNWVCVMITDSLGHKAGGEFGNTANYLKFSFKENKLFIALAPFDKGMRVNVRYEFDYFEIQNPNLTQTKYKLISLHEYDMVLQTTARRGKKILYHFVNQEKYSKDLDQIRNFREFDKVVLGIRYVSQIGAYYLSSYYLIDNSILNAVPCPQFGDRTFYTLGSYIEQNIVLPWVQVKDLVEKEIAIEFDVTQAGIENIAIVQKLRDDFDFQFYELIKGMSKKWEPLMVNGKIIDTRIRLNFKFTYNEN